MTLPVHIAQKLLQLQQAEKLPASSLKHAIIDELIKEGLIQKQMQGRGRTYLFVPDIIALNHNLHNRFGIASLATYLEAMQNKTANRSEAVEASSNSKIKRIRSFKGFMVTSLQPIFITINKQKTSLQPIPGLFTYVSDFKNFSVPADVTVVGVENAENFNYLQQQAYLFTKIKPLFVCRYPYSGDLLKWLMQIPNAYLHYGDIDFAGISIFLNEYQKHLHSKASFFIPPNLEELLTRFGNRALYNKQTAVHLAPEHKAYHQLHPVIELLHQHKKGLEQEVLITLRQTQGDSNSKMSG